MSIQNSATWGSGTRWNEVSQILAQEAIVQAAIATPAPPWGALPAPSHTTMAMQSDPGSPAIRKASWRGSPSIAWAVPRHEAAAQFHPCTALNPPPPSRPYTRIGDDEAKRIIRASIGDRLGYLRIAGGAPPWRLGVDVAGLATEGGAPPGYEAADDWPRLTVADLDWVLMRAVDRRLRHDLDQADGGEGSAAQGVRMRVVKVLADLRSEDA